MNPIGLQKAIEQECKKHLPGGGDVIDIPCTIVAYHLCQDRAHKILSDVCSMTDHDVQIVAEACDIWKKMIQDITDLGRKYPVGQHAHDPEWLFECMFQNSNKE